jgi:hypothetical protein
MAAMACVGGIGLTALLAREVLRLQARLARGTIGKPLGEARQHVLRYHFDTIETWP